jgi:Ca2+-dependent lipid-binding protein
MGKVFLYTLVTLFLLTVISFVLGYHQIGYIVGSIFGAIALGIGYVYSSKDDKYSTNYLHTDNGKKQKQ